ncbi:MAG TPA: hypothetical protein VK890_05865 [Bacteroidia bacterium]|nr:hypothetical protein [Bacteroidia bacterium]
MSAGFGFTNVATSSPYAIKVSDQLDYEISFWFLQPTTDPTFELNINCFDCALSTELVPIDVQSGASNKIFIPGNLSICSTPNKWNFMRAALYSCNEPLHNDLQPETSHAAGTNLIMKPGTAKLFVNLICVQNCMLVWDFKVKPLRTLFSTGFLQSSGLLEIWRRNNRPDMTAPQINALASEFLLPYDTNMVVTEL